MFAADRETGAVAVGAVRALVAVDTDTKVFTNAAPAYGYIGAFVD